MHMTYSEPSKSCTTPSCERRLPARSRSCSSCLNDATGSKVMGGRPDKRPGQFKQRSNQAGSYVFVAPALVEGTLIEGFKRVTDLPPGFPRAAFELFLISEVHPYDDGNGRVARAAMCAELTVVDQARLVIPIVFRNEYQTALRNLSREGRLDLYARTLAHAWRWTAAMPWQDRAAVDGVPRSYQRPGRLDRRRAHTGPTGTSMSPAMRSGNGSRSLESMLWDAANILRGPVDASDFKAYVFPLLFLPTSSW